MEKHIYRCVQLMYTRSIQKAPTEEPEKEKKKGGEQISNHN